MTLNLTVNVGLNNAEYIKRHDSIVIVLCPHCINGSSRTTGY